MTIAKTDYPYAFRRSGSGFGTAPVAYVSSPSPKSSRLRRSTPSHADDGAKRAIVKAPRAGPRFEHARRIDIAH